MSKSGPTATHPIAADQHLTPERHIWGRKRTGSFREIQGGKLPFRHGFSDGNNRPQPGHTSEVYEYLKAAIRPIVIFRLAFIRVGTWLLLGLRAEVRARCFDPRSARNRD